MFDFKSYKMIYRRITKKEFYSNVFQYRNCLLRESMKLLDSPLHKTVVAFISPFMFDCYVLGINRPESL